MTGNVKIVPAVLTDNPETLKIMLKQAESFTDYVQIDIMDGKFVPSHSITWQDIIPLNTGLQWEVHLMVEQPEQHLENFRKAGARKAVFHYEATKSPSETISLARKLGLEVGIAINPETPVKAIDYLANQLNSVLLLSVNPGFYGARFIPQVLEKVAELRKTAPNLEIGIDGGIKESNIIQVARSGVNTIFVGSAIFLQSDPAASYHKLKELVN